MKKLALAVLLLAPSVFADEPGVKTLPTITIYGRPQKPIAVVDISRPTAAREAGIAHQGLRDRLLEASMPDALKPQK